MKKIDPRTPGASSAGDDHCDPHGHGVGEFSSGGHVGMGRDDDGSFKNSSFSRGGVSEDGEAMVEKYRPRKSGGGPSNEPPFGASTNEEGDTDD